MHAKFTTVDSLFVSLGSYNFDRFSSRRNLESAIGIFDRQVATEMAQLHQRLADQSTLAIDDQRNPFAKFICWLAYFVMKTSGRNVFDGFDVHSESLGKRRGRIRNFARAESIATSLSFF